MWQDLGGALWPGLCQLLVSFGSGGRGRVVLQQQRVRGEQRLCGLCLCVWVWLPRVQRQLLGV